MHRDARRTLPTRFGTLFAGGFALALALGGSAVHAGPAGTWERISPPPQLGGAAAYDGARRLFYVFGGDGTNVLHATSVDGPPSEWVNVSTTGTAPPPLSGLSLSYDGVNDRLIAFGGRDAADHSTNQVWQLELWNSPPSWSLVATTGPAPSPRSSFGACFDESRQVLLVFGGKDSLGAPSADRIHQLDLGAPTPAWTAIAPNGDTPSARYGLTLCLDAAHDRAILFGGNDGSSDLNDAYTMNGTTHVWTELAVSGDVPAGCSNHFGAYDADDDLFLLWGGNGSDDEVRSLSMSTLQWTIEPNTNWQAGPVGHARPLGVWVPGGAQFLVLDGPEGTNVFEFHYAPGNSYWQNWRDPGLLGELRASSTFVLDRAHDVAWLACGANESGTPVNSTWSYSLGGPRGWINEGAWRTTFDEPPAVTRHSAVWDEARGRMLLFGGMAPDYSRSNAVWAMQTEYFPLNHWNLLTPSGTPPTPRYGSAAVYDPIGDRMIVFGGSDVSGYPRGDLWELRLSPTPAWSPIVAPGGPTGRQYHTAIYDERKHRMIVFAGTDSIGSTSDNDVWALNLPALTWTHLLPTGTPPPGRYQHTAVYDSRRERMLVWGGGSLSIPDMRVVWELDLAPATPAWRALASAVTATGLPIQRYTHAAVYDSTGDRMLVFGGLMPPFTIFGNDYPLKDLWSLQFDFSSGPTTAVDPVPASAALALGAPVPNPARGVTRLSYTLAHAAHVSAAIYDVAGRRIAGLEDGVRSAGPHELSWNGADAAGHTVGTGLYFCRLESEGRTSTQKLLRVH